MVYEIKFTALIKTFGKEFTHKQMIRLIDRALWKCEEFRDVQIIHYEGDTLDNPNPFSDIRLQILEDCQSASSIE